MRSDELVEFCVRLGISWNGNSALVSRRDATDSVQHFAASEDDEVIISAELVRSLGSLAAIIAYFDRAERVIPPLTLSAV